MNFRYYFRIYRLLSALHIKSRLTYRTDFVISTIGMVSMNIIGLVVLRLIFSSIKAIDGWSYNELVFIYGFALLSMLPFQLCFENIWRLGDNLVSGRFIIYYLRPLNILFYYVSEIIDIKAFGQFLVAIGIVIYCALNIDIYWSSWRIFLFFILLISSSLTITAIMLIASSVGFFVLHPTPVLVFVFRLKDYSHYPMTIYSSFFKYLFTFVIPIGFVGFYPARLVLRPCEIDFFAYFSPFVGILTFLIAYFIWTRGALKYSGTGT